MERFQDRCQIYKLPAPGLVELIEAGKADSPEAEELIRNLFANYPKLDALVLGCTHYPFAATAITRVLGEDTALLDGGDGTARETKRRLENAGLLRSGEGSVTIENSSNDPRLITLSMALLEEN